MTNRLWHQLPIPSSWTRRERQAFQAYARAVADRRKVVARETAKEEALGLGKPGLTAGVLVVRDLSAQGWRVKVDDRSVVSVRTPAVEADPSVEKARVQRQELLKRDEQLGKPSVRRFIADMEKPREFRGTFVSVFSLMRDGESLARELEGLRGMANDDPSILRTVIDPYVQVVHSGHRCRHTGLRLNDIWRYFRQTWTNQYTSTPGRTMLVLIRDRAAPFEPVMGIAAVGSAIVQIAERDGWIGWQSAQVLEALDTRPSARHARWIAERMNSGLAGLYIDDLIEDGLYWPDLWNAPSEEPIARLEKEAQFRRQSHHRFVKRADFRRVAGSEPNAWVARARSDLFRSKRCLALAELLRARAVLEPLLEGAPSRAGLVRALNSSDARRAIAGLVRRAKAEAVGTEIADLTVCGAVAPYNALLGGKLVTALAMSPSIVRAYQERYGQAPSEIASSLAGRPVTRRSNLAFVGTTSLYGSGSSQYNRIRIPETVLPSKRPMVFERLGRSRSFGTSHLAGDTVGALVVLSEQSRNGVRVNSIFGEGVNPKLRKVRDGLDQLGWPSDQLLRHGRHRIVYGVSLVENLLNYLLGIEKKPKYLFALRSGTDVERLTDWWYERWLSKRMQSDLVLEQVAGNSNTRPVKHSARVAMPPASGDAGEPVR